MIKDSAYIRKFTPEQQMQLEAIAAENKITTAKKVLLFALGKYVEQRQEIARLKRLITYKQNKIDALTGNQTT